LLQIRRGELRLVNDLAELIRLVLERRVDRTSLLYRITEEPRAISEMPELAELFDSPKTPPPRLSGDISGTFDPDGNDVPDLESISPLGSTASAFGDEYYDELPRSRVPAVLLAMVGLAVVGGGGYLAFRHTGSTSAPLAAVPPPDPVTSPAPVAAAPAPTPPAPAPAAPAAAIPAPAPAPAAAPAPEPAPAPAVAAKEPEPAPAPAVAAKEPEPTPPPPPAAKAVPPPEAAPPAAETARQRPARTQAMHPAPSRPVPPRPEPAQVAHQGQSYESLIREGDRLIESGKTKRAMSLFEEAYKLRPDGVAALTGLGYGWLDRGDARKAAAMFQQAMVKDGNFAPALFGLGEAYREQGRKNEALTAFRLYVTRHPNSREANAARRQIEQLNSSR
jgi:hypothetical protein